ncbi:uncharacterized protein K460DRAFT_354841 [Cucurbitaria berberidis CBS 394.84]|uniref:Uncharacterized protein n=1 Tax=Cucurbitaria berberidis CBS 394.84 TaxID=1168544 RepID=A0A9P4GGF7_9PLEO|nr:uncharacterized protein K460DRAFT_354841 [Cucurbitaria berberidis CBS 394.84]KAF1844979.1 hypothetical protein K460DRAFT_354841 [Cucurbitaria berberidis CBS 394.84]
MDTSHSSDHDDVSQCTPDVPTTSKMPSTTNSGMFEHNELPEAGVSATKEAVLEKTVDGSRYASLGLNRIPAHDLKRTTIPRSSLDKHSEVPHTIYKRQWTQDEEDLTDLEEMMIPKDARFNHHNRSSLPVQCWRPINKVMTSKFTTGYLTEFGWQSTNNLYWTAKKVEERITGDSGTTGPTNEELGAMKFKVEEEHTQEAENNYGDHASIPFLDAKYFDHYGYLNHSIGRTSTKVAYTSSHSPDHAENADIREHLEVEANGLHRMNSHITPTTTEDNTDTSADETIRDVIDDLAKDSTGKWELLEGNTNPPRTGYTSPHMLAIRLRNVETQEVEISRFEKIPHEDIDWSNRAHIQEISNWRSRVFHGRGFTTKKTNVLYTPEEDAWLMLFYGKTKAAIEAGNIVSNLGPVPAMEAFNSFFEGKVLKDDDGNALSPRKARDEQSLKYKINYKKSPIWNLRDEIRKLLKGKRGGALYVPVITEDELRRYQQDGIIITDDPREASKNAALGVGGIKARHTSPKRKLDAEDMIEENSKRVKPTSPTQTNGGEDTTSFLVPTADL